MIISTLTIIKKTIKYTLITTTIILTIFFIWFGYILLAPSQQIAKSDNIRKFMLIDQLILDSPYENYITSYFYSSGDRGVFPHSSVTYCNIPENEIEPIKNGIIKYLSSKQSVLRSHGDYDDKETHRFTSTSNKNKQFIITSYTDRGLNCISFAEMEFFQG